MTLSLLLKMGTLGQKGLNQARWGDDGIGRRDEDAILIRHVRVSFHGCRVWKNILYNTTTIQNGHVACQGQTFKRLLPPEN
jgi:hypothetical protein